MPFYRQVIDQVLLTVADGRLTPETQLPTVRPLAADLSVNLSTMAKAYREMEIRGIVETQPGTGTFVAERASRAGPAERRRALERLVDELLAKAGSQGFEVDEVADAVAARAAGPRRRSKMFTGIAASIAKKKAAQPEEETRSPLDSRAKRKQRARDRAADSRRVVSEIGLLAFVLVLAASGLAAAVSGSPVPVATGFPLAFDLLFSQKVAKQWERAVVLRFGTFRGPKGPGLFAVIPVLDVVSHLSSAPRPPCARRSASTGSPR